jgi:phosphopantetheine--protein transferase-like protein
MTVAGTASRCGIDTVEIARVERLLRETPEEDIAKIFSRSELDECAGTGRAASLAARFAAKEACLKLFPRETALGTIVAEDFSVARDPYGAPRVVCGAAAQTVLGRNRIRDISVSLSHDRTSATAVALAHPMAADAPWLGRVLYRLLPLRRKVILENLRRVFGDATPAAEIEALAKAHYAHMGRLLWEFLRFPWLSAQRRREMVRV